MAEFYITKDTSGAEGKSHQIYDATCKELPPIATMRYLGSYGSKDAAYAKARKYYDEVEFFESSTSK